MPELLAELHNLVPSYSNSFAWCGEDGRISNVYEESTTWPLVQPVHVEEFFDTRERAVQSRLSADPPANRKVTRCSEFFLIGRRTPHRSDFSNLVMRPMNCDRLLQLLVRDGLRSFGVLQLRRAAKDREFTDAEAQRLSRLAPFVAHALASRPNPDETETVESGETGLIMADRRGRLLSLSSQGRRLLYLATQSRLRRASRADPARLRTAVLKICTDLKIVGTGDAAAPPSIVRKRNPWGIFVFRAHLLQGHAGAPRQIGIVVTREVPLTLRLTRGAHHFGLSRRQTEVAVLLGLGKSHREISARLGISKNTVISHSRWIHARLGVHETSALRESLLRTVVAV